MWDPDCGILAVESGFWKHLEACFGRHLGDPFRPVRNQVRILTSRSAQPPDPICMFVYVRTIHLRSGIGKLTAREGTGLLGIWCICGCSQPPAEVVEAGSGRGKILDQFASDRSHSSARSVSSNSLILYKGYLVQLLASGFAHSCRKTKGQNGACHRNTCACHHIVRRLPAKTPRLPAKKLIQKTGPRRACH